MTAIVFFQLLASAIYLIPIAVVLIAISRRRTPLEEIALWISATVALDLLTCLLATRILSLDAALITSRVAWTLGGGIWINRRRNLVRKPADLDLRTLGIVLGSGIGAVCLSMAISRNYSYWDRDLHIPLVPLLRSQRLPFFHVFQARTILHYHFTGDVLAAALQTYSGARLHGSLALALAHDLMFGLFAVCLSLLIAASSRRRLWLFPAVLAVLLTGPFTVQRADPGWRLGGYTYLNLLSMSFRPHVSLAALLILGIFGAAVVRVTGRLPSPKKTMTILMLDLAALGVTDEASTLILALALGATWLVFPSVLHPARWRGLSLLVGLGALVVLANLVFQAALAPGSPVQSVRPVPWTVPGLTGSHLPLFSRPGLDALALDAAPFALIFIALVGFSIRANREYSTVWVIAVFCGTAWLSGFLAMSLLEINKHPSESHRFITVTEVVFPIVALFLLARLPAGTWERMPLLAALFLSATSTVFWVQSGGDGGGELVSNPVDCRDSAGARLFEKPRATYVPRSIWFSFVGCRPVFSPGTDSSWVTLQTSGPLTGRPAFERLHQEFVANTEDLTVICVPSSDDPACRYAHTLRLCERAGGEFETCHLSGQDRVSVLSRPW